MGGRERTEELREEEERVIGGGVECVCRRSPSPDHRAPAGVYLAPLAIFSLGRPPPISSPPRPHREHTARCVVSSCTPRSPRRILQLARVYPGVGQAG